MRRCCVTFPKEWECDGAPIEFEEVEEPFEWLWWWAWMLGAEDTEEEVVFRPRMLIVRRKEDCGVIGEGE